MEHLYQWPLLRLPKTVSENGEAGVSKRPTLPSSFFKFPIRSRLKVIQQYISSFEYKKSPQTSFNSHKSRPLARIMDTAKMMIYNPQPIKCVEAVFLALFLTAGIPNAERIPLSFKSELHQQVHQHIVLLVKYKNKYGAFGISRQHNLMSKEFEFESVSSIVDEYRKAYEENEHKLLSIWMGLPVEHNIESFNFVCWRHLSLEPSLVSWEQCSKALERHMNHAKRLWERWLLDGQRENKKPDLFFKYLDTKPPLNFLKSSSRKSIPNYSSAISTIKTVKRKQEPDSKLLKRRHVLQEMPAMRNIVSQPSTCKLATKCTSRVKVLPPLLERNSPVDLPRSTCSQCQSLQSAASIARSITSTKQENIRKITLKCYAMDPFSGSWRTVTKTPKMKQALRRHKRSVRKPKLLNPSEQTIKLRDRRMLKQPLMNPSTEAKAHWQTKPGRIALLHHRVYV